MSPTARALLALEAIQNRPGITASRLGERLGVSERAARRYVSILREADLPIDSLTGPYGGYRVGRGLRLPPLMFTAAEALGLAMAVLEGHRDAADATDVVGSALAKVVRALPEGVADPVRAVREATTPSSSHDAVASPELTNQLVQACVRSHRLRLAYRLGTDEPRMMEVEPWAVVLRHSRWYLLCWSHSKQAQRALRIDRMAAIEVLPETFAAPSELDPLRTMEEHLSRGWTRHLGPRPAVAASQPGLTRRHHGTYVDHLVGGGLGREHRKVPSRRAPWSREDQVGWRCSGSHR
ncbi:MAG: helix-turn-helix transcriptional regulator [Nocardioidaceae bacterium]